MKNQNTCFKVILLLLCVTAFKGSVFSQDSLSKKTQHLIGVELQQNVFDNNSSNTGNQGGYHVFYRFSLQQKANWLTAFNGGMMYRSGSGIYYSGGKGGSSSIFGNYEFVRLVVGIAPCKQFGKNKNLTIGAGLNVGSMIYAKGNISRNEVSGGISTVTKANVNEALHENYISLHFEISHAFKFWKKNYLVIGLKQYIETPDFAGKNYNSTTGLILAYKIR